MDWQTVLSLCIVAITAALLVRYHLRERKKTGCGNCALADTQNGIKYAPRKPGA